MPRSNVASRLSQVALLTTIVVLTFSAAYAQTIPSGITMWSTQIQAGPVSVDMERDTMVMRIPILSKPGAIPYTYEIIENLGTYGYLSSNNAFLGNISSISGGLVPPRFVLCGSQSLGFSQLYGGNIGDVAYVQDGTGSKHYFDFSDGILVGPLRGNLCPVGIWGPTTLVALDGSGYTAVVTGGQNATQLTWVVYDKAGNVVSSTNPGVFTDPDGNSIGATDTLGQVPVTSTIGRNTGNPDTYSYTDVNNGTQTYTVAYSVQHIKTVFGCNGNYDIDKTGVYLPSSITLPNGAQYVITYEGTPGFTGDVTGRLKKVTLPAGGYVSFAYSGGHGGGLNGFDCNSQTIPQIQISENDNNGHTSTRTYLNTYSSQGFTETDSLGNVTTHLFTGIVETQRVVTDVSRGQLGKTVIYCGACGGGNSQNTSISQMDVYTYPGTSTSPSLVETKYDIYGDVTEESRWDYGATNPPTGNPISKTTYTYDTASGPCGNLSNPYMVNRPCSITTVDQSGAQVRQTNYTYNATGHPIQTQKWVSGTTFLTSSATYNSNGTIASSTDVNSAATNFHYDGVGGCNNLLLTSTDLPVSSLTTSQKWNCVGGVLTSTTDANGQVTNYGYADQNGVPDPLWRLLSTTDPLGNVTRKTYSAGTTLPATVETSMVFNGSASAVDSLATYDGLTRPIFQQTRQAPGSSNFDTVALTYDVLGRQVSKGNPCVSTASTGCSSPTTTATYDALNRPLVITDGGGGTLTYTYTANATSITVGPAPAGENVKKRQLQVDGLGRLSSVCEITSAAGSGSCVQVSPGSGFLTTYGYDALGNLTSVNQNAQGSPIQTHTFTYDGLSRVISEKNPEWNNIAATYTYDSDSAGSCTGTYNGDLVRRTDPAGNVSCSKFDPIHRITATTYPSGPNSGSTPSKAFVYDSTTFSCPTGSNVKGRLAEAYTGSISSKITDIGLCYSPRGETTDVWESTPNSGGLYHTAASYWANSTVNTLAGFLASGNTFVPTQTYTPDGEGRWKSVAAISGPNPISTTLYSPASQITGITYGSTDTDAFTYDNALRMNKYTFTLNGSSEVGTPTWNANGTLQTLVITDPFNAGNVQTCTYAYDDLARIASANCGTPWSQTFSYDPFGNITKTGSISWQPGYNQSTNRYTLAGTTYDADGNLTNDSFHSYAWDSNGRPVTLGGKTMTYDALGRMVEKLDGSTYTQFVYSPSGSLFARMSGQGATSVRVPLPGSWAVYGSNSTFNHYEHLDWLGNSRLSSNQSRQMTSDIAYAPFGEPYASAATSGVSFTGMRSDVIGASGGVTNGLYDFLSRELPPTQGRWLSPDPVGDESANLANPQSWNRYAYVGNDPLRLTDPTGLVATGPGTSEGGQPAANCDSGSTDPTACTLKDFSTGQGVAVSVDCSRGRCTSSETVTVSASAPQSFFGRIGSWFSGAAVGFVRWGKLGGPQHRAAINRVAQSLQEDGYTVQREVQIETPNGAKSARWVDVVGYKNGRVRMYQIGKQNVNGSPVAREVQALNDIEEASGIRPQFVPYNFGDPNFGMPEVGPVPDVPATNTTVAPGEGAGEVEIDVDIMP